MSSNPPLLWRLVTLNHHKNMKTEPSWLIPEKLTAHLELLMAGLGHMALCILKLSKLQVNPSHPRKCQGCLDILIS